MQTPKRFTRRDILKTGVLGLGAAAGPLLAACSAPASSTTPPAATAVPAVAKTAAPTTASNNLVVYGWAGNWDLWFSNWAKQFEEETNIKLKYMSGQGAAMRQRIMTENASQSDVFISTPGDAFTLASEGFLADIPWDSLSNSKDVDQRFRFKQVGIWGYDLWEIGYNTKQLSGADIPKKWTDLSDPKYKGKMSMPDPANDASAWMWMTFQKAYGDDKAWDMLTKMYGNSARLASTPGDSERAIATGEVSVSPLAMGNIMVAAEQAGGSVLGQPPEDGAFLMLNSITVMKNAPNRDNALKFLNFYFSPKVQANIMNELGISIATNGSVKLAKDNIAKTGLGGQTVDQVLKTAYTPDWPYWSEKVSGTPRISTLLKDIQGRVKK